MHKYRWTVLAALAALILLVACGGGAATDTGAPPPAGSDATEAPQAQPAATARPTPQTIPLPIGIDMVDRVAEAITSGNTDATLALFSYTTLGCTTAEGLGGPPKCAEGVADGTPVTYLPILGPGEGTYWTEGQVKHNLPPAGRLGGVFAVPADAPADEAFPNGDYGLVFFTPQENIHSITLRVTDAGIVRVDLSPETPAEVLANSGGEIIAGPIE